MCVLVDGNVLITVHALRIHITTLNILSELAGVCCITLRDRMGVCVPGGWPQRTWLITHIDRPTSSLHTEPMEATISHPLVTIHLVSIINFVLVALSKLSVLTKPHFISTV